MEVQPRQLTSQPRSKLDWGGGNESSGSSSFKAQGRWGEYRIFRVANEQLGEQTGGPQRKGMSAAPKSCRPTELVVGHFAIRRDCRGNVEGRSYQRRTG